MTTNKQQFASRQDLIANIIEKVLSTGIHSDKHHTITVDPNYTIWVKENDSKRGVAFSSTKADFESSLVEFVTDYFG